MIGEKLGEAAALAAAVGAEGPHFDAPRLKITVKLDGVDVEVRRRLYGMGFRPSARGVWTWTPRPEELAGGGAGLERLRDVEGLYVVLWQNGEAAYVALREGLSAEEADRAVAALREASTAATRRGGVVVWQVPKSGTVAACRARYNEVTRGGDDVCLPTGRGAVCIRPEKVEAVVCSDGVVEVLLEGGHRVAI